MRQCRGYYHKEWLVLMRGWHWKRALSLVTDQRESLNVDDTTTRDGFLH
jgi:hypothetical protein